jgi:hypothetical protein
MVKDFSERERARAKENANADKTRMDAEQRAKANAADLLDKIVIHMITKGIGGIEHEIDQRNNHVILKGSAGSLERALSLTTRTRTRRMALDSATRKRPSHGALSGC